MTQALMRRGKTGRGQSQPDLTQEGDEPAARLLWRLPRCRALCCKLTYLLVSFWLCWVFTALQAPL